MPKSEHLFIHPWFDGSEAWAGLKVSCAGDPNPCWSALLQLCQHPTTQTLDRQLSWFIPVDPTQVHLVDPLPAERTVLILTPPAPPKPEWLAACRRLRDQGRRLALVIQGNDALIREMSWDYLLISLPRARTLPPFTFTALSACNKVIVTDVFTQSDHVWATSNGCQICTGEYLLARPGNSSKPDMTRVRLLRLLSLVVQDAATHDIEEVLRQEPKLSYSLLRLVNSAALGMRSPVTTFAAAINLLGRRQLQRWLQLLIYANPDKDQAPNPLLLQSANRGRLMELLASTIQPAIEMPDLGEAANMIGTFSLLDVLLNLPMTDIVSQLPLIPEVRLALTDHHGPLGQLIKAISLAEGGNFPAASAALETLGIDCATLMEAQLTAMEWACRIRSAA